jgi:hypothetical protein
VNTFVLKTGHPALVGTGIGVMLVVLILLLAIKLERLTKNMEPIACLYFYVHAIFVSLVYLDVLPEWLQGEK